MMRSAKTVIGYKLLRADYSSLRTKGRVVYPPGRWVKVKGNGCYVAVTGGLLAGGVGPVLARVEAREKVGGVKTKKGTRCYRWVRVTPLTRTTQLAETAHTAVAPVVRWAAVERLTDPVALAGVIQKEANPWVFQAAIARRDFLRRAR